MQPQSVQPNTQQASSVPHPTSGQGAKAARDQRASVQNHLMFSEIKDGIVVMRDGSLRMVIMASAINFDLKSPQEQDAIEFAYQGFLNGLHFPIQIVVRSRRIDLDNYLARLDQIKASLDNELLAGLMEDYVFNIRGLLDEVNIMNKEFYVVVPLYIKTATKETVFSKFSKLLKPNQDTTQTTTQFEQSKRDIVQRTNLVAQGLAQMGVRAVVLSTQELVELFYTAYNIDESQSQSLINTDEITTAGVVRAPRPEKKEQVVGAASNLQKEPEPPDLFAQAQNAGLGAAASTQQTTQQAQSTNNQPPGGPQ